jgi:ATP-dependent DNA helicase RecG
MIDLPIYEEQLIPGAHMSDLDLTLVRRHLDEARGSGRLMRPEEGSSPEEFLLYHRCVIVEDGEPIPTMAGMLFFGRDPQRWLPQAEFVLGHFPGDKATSQEARHLQRYGGTLPEQISAVERYIEQHMERGFFIEGGPQRRERPQFPPVVLREMLVNAAGHRDYSLTGASIRVSMFPNRIEVASPGGPPIQAPLNSLLQTSHARNRSTMRLLWQVRFCEAFGLGLRTILDTMAREGLPEPSFDTAAANFFVSITGHQPMGLNMEIAERLTEPQMVLLRALVRQGNLSPRQASELLPQRSERSIRNDLNALVELGVVARIGETRAVSYRLTRDIPRLGL